MLYNTDNMIRTQLQLTKRQYDRLRHWVARLDKSIAHQVRDAIDAYLDRLEMVENKKVADVAGKFKPLPEMEQEVGRYDRFFVDAISAKRSDRK